MACVAQPCSAGVSVAFGAGTLTEPQAGDGTMPPCLSSLVAGRSLQGGPGCLASVALEVSRNEKVPKVGVRQEANMHRELQESGCSADHLPCFLADKQ